MNDLGIGINLSWLDEKVEAIEKHKVLYFFIRLFLFRLRRKLKYKELYLIFYGIEKGKNREEIAKKIALNRTLKVYMDNNNGLLPKGYRPSFKDDFIYD